jgi:hypothetical protein
VSPPTPPAEETPVQVKPFAAYLTATNGGRTHTQLSEGLHHLVDEVLRTGRMGTVTLTVSVKADDVEARRLIVTEAVAVKLPKMDPRKSVFWADDDGNLARSDPSQLSFGDITAVPAPDQTKGATA